jgi:hypothetical protein
VKKRTDARASDDPLMKIPLFPVLFSNGSYVDGPLASVFYFGGERLAAFGHMSGLT